MPRPARPQKKKTIFSFFILFFLTIVIFIGVWQIDQVRHFFGRASGTPANIVINTEAVLGPLPRPWQNLAQGGESFDWRLQPVSAQVRGLKPNYIRIDHIYDFYEIVQGSPGALSFNWEKFDLILRDIQAVGAKPYIALSYMPPAIAKDDIVSEPHRWADWQLTVQKTIEHVSGTLGIEEVYYEVWNEPDLFGGWKYYGNKNYLTLYTHAAIGASRAQQVPGVKNFYLGGPGITALYRNWFHAMAKHVIANNLKFDFFSWHRYDHDLKQFESDFIDARAWLSRYPELSPTVELHVTEWGPDSENHRGYDNSYSAVHAVATAITMTNAVDKAFLFEIQDGKDPQGQEYWGRWGILTHQDFGSHAKPRYRALQLLDRIGDQRLPIQGQGSWVKALAARNDLGQTEVLMANFDPWGRHAETVPVTFNNIEPGGYQLQLEYFDGRTQTVLTATSAAVLRTQIPMPANSILFAKLIKQ
ncbi:MAG: hypothetical protein GF381_03835 [Candidatus Pacebacteria bacterium]|nr:hypothetical protein [Candidatus Paceibacterota bacterium]